MLLKRFYLENNPEKKEEIWFTCTENWLDGEILGLIEDIYKNKENLIAANKNINNNRIKSKQKTRKQKWNEKHLHEYIKPQVKDIAHNMTGTSLWSVNLKGETESLIIQNNTKNNNYIKTKIYNTQKIVSVCYDDRDGMQV